MTDQLLLQGPEKVQCPCSTESCTQFGRPLKSGHVRGCPCPRCCGGRNRRSGMTAQRQFQKKAGIKQAKFRGINGNEEGWADYWRWEHKSGGIARPAVTAYVNTKAQSEVSRAIGDNRPFAAGLTYSGVSVVVVNAEDWATHVVPLLEGAA